MRATLAVLTLLAAARASAAPSGSGFAINRHIDDTFNKLAADGTLTKAVTPFAWQADSFSASSSKIDMAFKDAAGGDHAVALLIQSPPGGADGQGDHFYFKFGKGATSADEKKALLNAATAIDSATPSEALTPEDGPVRTVEELSGDPNIHGPILSKPPPNLSAFSPAGIWWRLTHITLPRTAPKSVALTIGAVETLIIVVAIFLGLFLPFRRQDR